MTEWHVLISVNFVSVIYVNDGRRQDLMETRI